MDIKVSDLTLANVKGFVGVPEYVTSQDFNVQIAMQTSLAFVLRETRLTKEQLDAEPMAVGPYLKMVTYIFKNRDAVNDLKEDVIFRNMLHQISEVFV